MCKSFLGWAVWGVEPPYDFNAIDSTSETGGLFFLTISARTSHYFFMSFDYAHSAKICSSDSQQKLKIHYLALLLSLREYTGISRDKKSLLSSRLLERLNIFCKTDTSKLSFKYSFSPCHDDFEVQGLQVMRHRKS